MVKGEFLNLLDLFVEEDWKNHETYNSFIRGFGNEFDNFTPLQSARFVHSLASAGLNQTDIFEAVLDKINSSEMMSRVSYDLRCNIIMKMVQTAVEADMV